MYNHSYLTCFKVGFALFIIVGCVVVSGCQTVTKIKCNTKNWHSAGEQDGELGKPLAVAFEAHDQSCREAGSQADKPKYEEGYRIGILQFCTFPKAETYASNGFENQNVCPEEKVSEFNSGYSSGLALLCTEAGANRLGSKVGVYRGTCNADKQETFLPFYLNSIEIAKNTAELDQISASANLTTVESSLANIDSNILAYDIEISKATKSGNESLKETLISSRTPLESERIRLRKLKRSYNADKTTAAITISTAEEMLFKWMPFVKP